MDRHIRETITTVVDDLAHHRALIAHQKLTALLALYPPATPDDALRALGIEPLVRDNQRFGTPTGMCHRCGMQDDIVLGIAWEAVDGRGIGYPEGVVACRQHAADVWDDLDAANSGIEFTLTVTDPEQVTA